MKIRNASEEDKSSLYALYKAVAQNSGGIARTEDEITEDYIDALFSSLENKGIMLVGTEEETGALIAEIHASKYGIKIFDHILTSLTIVVHPDYQGKGIGKKMFEAFLNHIEHHRPEIGRVELESRATNKRSIALYRQLGFVQEGVMKNKTRNPDGKFEDSILMTWTNPAFKF